LPHLRWQRATTDDVHANRGLAVDCRSSTPLSKDRITSDFLHYICAKFILRDQMEPRMRRQNFKAAADDDSLPVMVPRNDKAAIPISPERVRRLRKHLVAALRALRTMKNPEQSVSPLRQEPAGFAARVARTACSLCKGWCCRNGEDHAFLDERTMARVRCARLQLDVRAVLRLYVERVPEAGYEASCIFHGRQGCTLNRSLRSDVCNSYFCGGLHDYMAGGDAATPTMIIAGVGDKMRTSPILMP